MKGYKKVIQFSILFLLGINVHLARAQELNINGDTIYVNAEGEFVIYFPTRPRSFSSLPVNAPYFLKSVDNGVTITAKGENTSPATLKVSEGGRNHLFFIVFKKDIDLNNNALLNYSYPTVKILADHIKASKLAKSVSTTNQPIQPAVADNSLQFNTLIEQGDKYLQQQNYESAKLSYDRAQALRPDDLIPKQRLEALILKQVVKENAAGLESEQKYLSAITEAKIYFDQKRYPEAREAYNRALILRPGNLFATNQLEKINTILSGLNEASAREKSRELYREYIAQGEKALGKKEFIEARTAYEQALNIKPNDVVALNRLKLIDEKEKAKKQEEEFESNYSATIQLADNLFRAGDLIGAKTAYHKALTFFMRAGPQEQIKRIDKTLIEQAAQEKNAKQEQERRLMAEKMDNEKLELEKNYDAAIQSADIFFKNADYENAKIEYNKALGFITRDRPREQIIRINKIVADQIAKETSDKQALKRQELENKYTAAMELGDKLYLAGDYTNAKIEYNKAMSLIQKPEPLEQIKKINRKLAQEVEEANAQKLRLAREAEITAKYTSIIKNADVEFDRSNYIRAKKLYTDAVKLKPTDKDANERLLTIEQILSKIATDLKARKDSIELEKGITRKYNLAVSRARSKYVKNDFVNAKLFYNEAKVLKPAEEEPKNRLEAINQKLDDIAREIEINNSYELKIVMADSQLVAKSYDAALINYNEALLIKPLESYPRSQLKYIQAELVENERRKEIQRKEEEVLRYKNALARAKKAYAEKRYLEAKSSFDEALAIHPNNQDALRSLEIISYQLERARADSLRNVVVKDTIAVKSKKKRKNKSQPKEKIIAKKEEEKAPDDNLASQSTAITYTNEELKNKYPDIDFSVLPPDQPFNQTAVYTKDKDRVQLYRDMLKEKPRLSISYSDQKIKMICTGINFQDGNSYIKLLIQNYSDKDFLTGAMMITWTKMAGNHVKLYPNHLFPSPLPVIMPGHEAPVIYSCKSYDVLNEEILNFELIDRPKKVTLNLNIPGSVYNSERAR